MDLASCTLTTSLNHSTAIRYWERGVNVRWVAHVPSGSSETVCLNDTMVGAVRGRRGVGGGMQLEIVRSAGVLDLVVLDVGWMCCWMLLDIG